jgi:hypothetical protein
MKMSNPPVVSLVALVALVAALAWFGILRSPDATVGPSVYSRSAIGHAGL